MDGVSETKRNTKKTAQILSPIWKSLLPWFVSSRSSQQNHGWPMRGNIKFVLFTQMVRGDTNQGLDMNAIL
jgi:hypothetical protein